MSTSLVPSWEPQLLEAKQEAAHTEYNQAGRQEAGNNCAGRAGRRTAFQAEGMFCAKAWRYEIVA